VAQTVTIGKQKVCPESESLKLSATPTPQVENPSDSDSTALLTTKTRSMTRKNRKSDIKRFEYSYFISALPGRTQKIYNASMAPFF